MALKFNLLMKRLGVAMIMKITGFFHVLLFIMVVVAFKFDNLFNELLQF